MTRGYEGDCVHACVDANPSWHFSFLVRIETISPQRVPQILV